MPTWVRAIFILCATWACVPFFANDASAQCVFQIDGRVATEMRIDWKEELDRANGGTVIHAAPSNLGQRTLSNVRVLVDARKQTWHSWTKWHDGFTDNAGRFSFSKNRNNCADRQFRVRVRFKNDDLEIWRTAGRASTWTAFKDWGDTDRSTSLNLVFGDTATDVEDLPDLAVEQSNLWYLYTEAARLLSRLAPGGLGFKDKVGLNYLYHLTDSSHATPSTHVVHLRGEDFNVRTALHELMHVWAYQHSTGSGILTWDVITTLGTHGYEKNPAISFHEGFAEYAAWALEHRMFAWGPPLPFSRHELEEAMTATTRDDISGVLGSFYFNCRKLDPACELPREFADLEHWDTGWQHIFSLLTLPEAWRYHFGDTWELPGESSGLGNLPWVVPVCVDPNTRLGCTSYQPLDFAELLALFRARGNDAKLDTDDMNLVDFKERLDRRTTVDDATWADVEILSDHTSSEQPWDLLDYCPNPGGTQCVIQASGIVLAPVDPGGDKRGGGKGPPIEEEDGRD